MSVSTADFDKWLRGQTWEVPLERWGPAHTKIAVAFAEAMVKRGVNRTLDEALNSGDGSYRP